MRSGEANAHCNLVISRKHVLRFNLDIGKSVEERLGVLSPNARAALRPRVDDRYTETNQGVKYGCTGNVRGSILGRT